MQRTDQKRIVLAGRAFVPAGESTVEHDIEVMRLLRAAGLETTMASADPGEEVGLQVMTALVTTGTLLPLVACLIVPETRARRRPGAIARALAGLGIARPDVVRGGWTPEVQAETVGFLKGLDEPEDKQQVYALVSMLLLPFLSGAPASWRPSPRSSGSQEAGAPNGGGSPPSAGATSVPGAS